MQAISGGVKVGDDEITFASEHSTAGDAMTMVTVKRAGAEIGALMGKGIDLNRSQGEIGL